MESKVINPYTGRQIKVGGPTYRKLKNKELWPSHLKEIESMEVYQPPNGDHPTGGWSDDAPKRGTERHLLKEQCGDKCFLLPQTESFPICPKCRNGRCICQLDCRGLRSAKIRAHQYHYDKLYQPIDYLIKKKC